MLTALSIFVSFMVPLILIEPADSMSGKLICNMVEHLHNDDCYIGGMLNCSVTEEHIHTEDCYKKFSLFNFKKAAQQLSEGQDSHVDNVTLSNAADRDAHEFVEDENETVYSPNNVPLYVLLFGEGASRNWVDPTKSLEKNLEIANSEYFLGFASDFCAFIEGDFKATEADAEGRVAVGGDIIFTKDWNYQIGSGDYVTMKPLDEIDGYTEYDNVSGYASAIVGGKMVRVNTLSTGWGSNRTNTEDYNVNANPEHHRVNVNDQYSYTVYYKPEEGLYKSFIVGNVDESSHYDKASGTDIPYGENCQHDYPADCPSCTAKEGEGMSSNPHHYLSTVNEKAQLYPYDKVNELFDKTFSTIRGRSLVLSKNQGTVTTGTQRGEIIFDGSNVPRDASTVYFTVEDWLDYRTIKFKNIPENANVVVNCGDPDKISIAGTYDERKANPDADTNVSTSISTNNDDNWISKSRNGKNNDPNSARILYNFYNASELEINGNFNGTILAPNADVKSFDGKCPGHLSGALIAKSFYGSLEFGYRPYRGGNDILGMTSGYEVPVEKFYSNTNEYLPGAVFTVNELLEGNNKKYLSSFNSSGDKDFIALPSQVDYSGKTLYMPRTEEVGTVTTTAVTNVTVNTTLNTTTEPINPMELTFTNSVSSDNKNVQYEIKNSPQGANTYKFYLGDNQIADLQNATGNWQYNNEKTGNLKIKVVAYKDGQEIAESYAILTVEGLTLQASFEDENIVVGTTNVNLALTNIPEKTRKVIYKIDNVDHVVEKTDEDIDFSYVFVPTENKEYTIEATAYDESDQILAKTETYVDATIEIELPEPEEPQTNDMLIINVPDDKTLAGLKLNLKDWDDCEVNVNYYDANDVLLNQTPNTCSNNKAGSNFINIPCSVENSDSRIDKVVIEVIEGKVSLASYDITYAASSNASTTIKPVGEILENGQTKSFYIDNAEILYSFTLTTKSNDKNLPSGSKFRYTLHNADGVINGHSDIECQFDGTSNYKTIILNDIQGITKIDIKADGTSIPIESYSVTKLVDNDYTLQESPIEPKIITKQYIIEEEQPPLGFFEIDYCYKVTVKETVDRSQVYNKYYPKKVDTEITIQKVKKDDYSSSYDDSTPETLSFTIENDYADTGNTRTITIDETVFTIAIGVDGIISSVSKGDTVIENLPENGPSVLEGNYYFNPDTAMIVPMPENSVAFNNSPGLLFRKVGENGVAISGVEIQLKAVNGDVEECGWSWDNDNSSECLIDVSRLSTGKVYYFEESNTFGKYEKAPNIYFQKENADTIVYWTGSVTRPESVNTLNLKENRTIRMTNTPFPGIKLNLKKVHYNSGFTNTTLSGAKFSLYAKDNPDPICSEVVTDAYGNISFDLPADNPYVASGNGSNGTYLKPGVYYLTEIVPEIPENLKPNGVENPAYANPGNIYFTVKDDFTVVSGYQNVEALGFEKKDNQIGFVTFNGQKLNGGATSIPDIVSFKFYITAPNTLQIYTSLIDHDNGNNKKDGKGPNECLTDETYNGTAVKVYQYTTDEPTDVSKFEIQNHGNKDISNEIKYIELVDSNGKKYVYSSSDNTTDFEFKNPMLAPNFEKTPDTNTVTLTVGNKIYKENIDITVNKKWAGDTNFESFRKDVELRLYRTTTELNGTNPDFSNTSLEKVTGDGITNPVTLKASTNAPNDANTWTYTWSDLPIADEDNNTYYYYVKEETELPEYVTTYSKTGEDVITITNTLKTVDIPVEKRWIGDYANVTRPSAITLQLQSKKTGTENLFADVPGKTLTLTAANEWQGTFEDLPEGYDYQVVETNSGSNSWASMTNYETVGNNIKIVVTNTLEVGSLKITKSWSGSEESADSRPKQLKFRIYRSTVSPYYTESDVSTVDVKQDYARLLQYSLYFYDANMCGNDVSENSKIAWRSNCHTNDEVPGGYHDAGDHVVFGLPQGYAASMLGWSYYEFIKTGTNPNKSINEYDVAHYKLILDRFYDFFSRSVKYKDGDSSKEVEWLLVQKGNGNVDHGYWGPPENQSRNNATEMYWRNDTGADIAAEYAAALALGYLNFYDDAKSEDDPENVKYRNYLTLAKKLYDYAERVKNDKNGDRTWKMVELTKYADGCLNKWGINLDETQKDDRSVPYPGFYLSDSCTDDMALAAGWLCLASEKAGDNANVISEYESACKNDTPGWAFSWNDVSLAAACVYAHVKEDTVSDPWQNARKFINDNKDKNSPFYRPDTNKCWGSARYNAALQMAALVVDKNDTQADYNDWAKSQMNMILGANQWAKDANGNPTSVCLITGFADNSAKSAHHRAASGWESIGEYKDPTHTTYDTDGKTLIGAMVGGPYFGVHSEAQMEQNDHDNLSSSATHGDYLDDLHDYCCNEVAIDYQAGLVGAALGLYYFNGTGERSEKIEGVEIEGGSRDNTEAYPATANANVFDMVSFNMPRVAVLADDFTMFTDESNNKQYFVINEQGTINNRFSSIAEKYNIIGYKFITSCEGTNHTLQVKGIGLSQQSSYENTYISITPTLIPKTYYDSIECHGDDWGATCSNYKNATIRIYVEPVTSGGGSEGGDEPTTPTEFSITSTIAESYEICKEIELTASENATWESSIKDTSKVTLVQSGQSCKVKFLEYISDELKIIAKNANNETDDVILKAKPLQLNVEPTSVASGQKVNLSVNYTPDGSWIKYSVGNKQIDANDYKPDSTQEILAEAINNNKVIASATGKITVTSSGGTESGGESDGEYYLIDTIEYNNQSFSDFSVNLPSRLGTESVGRIVIEFYSGKSNADYCGELKANSNVVAKYSANYRTDNNGYSQLNNQTLTVDFDSSIMLESLVFDEHYNQDNNAVVKKIYFYGTTSPAKIIKVPKNMHTLEESEIDTVGFEEGSEITWTVTNESGTVVENAIVDGKFKPTSKGTYTIKATAGNQEATVTVNVERSPFTISINKTQIRQDSEAILSATEEGVTYAATGEARELVEITGNTVKLKSESNLGNESISVKIKGTAADGEMSSNEVDLTILGNLYISGEGKMASGYTQTLTAGNVLGNVIWDVEDVDGYDIDRSDNEIITVKSGDVTLFNVNKTNGEVTAVGSSGTITVIATDTDGATAEFDIKIDKVPVRPVLPDTSERELVTEVIMNSTDSWTKTLSNLPLKDSKGNTYYYYVEEYAYTYDTGNDPQWKVLSTTGGYITGTNATYIPISYSDNGVAIDKNGTKDVTIGNEMIAKVQGQLPSTGGSGVKTYYYIGGAIMLLGIAGFTGIKRRERKRRKE